MESTVKAKDYQNLQDTVRRDGIVVAWHHLLHLAISLEQEVHVKKAFTVPRVHLIHYLVHQDHFVSLKSCLNPQDCAAVVTTAPMVLL
jgi:hypothetical protein